MTISFLGPEYFIVFHSLRCLRFSFHFSTQPFHYYSLCLSLGSGSLSLNAPGNLIADFIWAPCHFHYIFHSYGLENFIVYFILMAWGFQWKFHSHTSVYFIGISYLFSGTFNGFFILVSWVFHCEFHIYSLLLSMDFSFLCLEIFIYNFISIHPATFNEYFILLKYPKMNKLSIKNYLGYL